MADELSERSALRCPNCHSLMVNGFIPTGGGMHWFRKRDASATDFAEHIPGTHAWLRSARLPAWRCRKCQLIVFRYGETAAVARHDASSHSSADVADDDAEAGADNG